MGTTNEIKSTNIGQGLIGKPCQECKKKFTEKDICENGNWEVQFDTSTSVNLVENEKAGYGYHLTIWIKEAYHEFCDEAEEVLEKEKTKEKVNWKELGENIKNSHPLDSYNKTLKKVVEINKKNN